MALASFGRKLSIRSGGGAWARVRGGGVTNHMILYDTGANQKGVWVQSHAPMRPLDGSLIVLILRTSGRKISGIGRAEGLNLRATKSVRTPQLLPILGPLKVECLQR